MNLPWNVPFEWQIGLRYTRAGRRSSRNSFVSFISVVSMGGIALGVAALIVVLSVMNGFQKDVTDRMLSVLSHIELYDVRGALPDWRAVAAEAARNTEVRAAAPFVEVAGMLIRDDAMRPAVVRGILPQEEGKVSDIVGTARAGSFDALKPGTNNIVLGIELARELGLAKGDRVTLALALQQNGGAGISRPRLQPFTVAGVFEAGHNEYDSGLAFVHLEDAQTLTQLTAPQGLRLRVADIQRAPQVARALKDGLAGEFLLRDWTLRNPAWFAAVQSQKHMMFIILGLIVAVAAFNVVATLVMTVMDKQADIAILRTLGASPAAIMRIFMVQGMLVGLVGTGLGVGCGVLLALNLGAIASTVEAWLGVQFLSKSIYFISSVPSDLHWDDVTSIGLVAAALSFAATLYPSWWAARVKPAEALRYE